MLGTFDEMSQGHGKECPHSGKYFVSKSDDIALFRCREIEFTAVEKEFIAELSPNCLCPECLVGIKIFFNKCVVIV